MTGKQRETVAKALSQLTATTVELLNLLISDAEDGQEYDVTYVDDATPITYT